MHIALLAHLVAAGTPSPSPSSSSSGGSSGGGFNYSILLFALVIAGMFWFMSRSQRKQRQRMQDLQSRLTPGQEIMTSAGIYGRVVDSAGDQVRVEVSPGVVLTLAKQAVARVVEPTTPTGPDEPGVLETDDSRERTVAD